MIFRLLVGSIFAILVLAILVLTLWAEPAKPQVCTPTLTPGQAFYGLTQLDGIGAKKAQQIILYRQMIAPFATADDLANVKGIGKATVDKNRHRITTQ